MLEGVDTQTIMFLVMVVATIAAMRIGLEYAHRSKSRVQICYGKNNQEMIVLKHSSGSVCEIYLHGATVTRFCSGKGREILWLSRGAVFDGKKAIRGGIPLVFPQFGPKADDRLGVESSMTQHGFARTSKWRVKKNCVLAGDACCAVLTLSHDESTLAKFPFKFSLEYVVTLSKDKLRTALKITNMDEKDMAPQALLHTYFATQDVEKTRVGGIVPRGGDATTMYLDQLTGKKQEESRAFVRFDGETDLIYDDLKTREITIDDSVGLEIQTATVENFGEAGSAITPFNPDLVVWNPHVAKAKAMSDFDDEGWKNMCCVEPGVLSAEKRPTISPANSITLSQTISL